MRTIIWVEYYDKDGYPGRKTVGVDDVVEISEHRAAGEGDKWYYDIVYEKDGAILRTFNVTRSYSKETPDKF